MDVFDDFLGSLNAMLKEAQQFQDSAKLPRRKAPTPARPANQRAKPAKKGDNTHLGSSAD